MPAKSEAQAGLMGLALSVKRGDKKLGDIRPGLRRKIVEINESMSDEELTKFTSTERKGLPKYKGTRTSKLRKVHG